MNGYHVTRSRSFVLHFILNPFVKENHARFVRSQRSTTTFGIGASFTRAPAHSTSSLKSHLSPTFFQAEKKRPIFLVHKRDRTSLHEKFHITSPTLYHYLEHLPNHTIYQSAPHNIYKNIPHPLILPSKPKWLCELSTLLQALAPAATAHQHAYHNMVVFRNEVNKQHAWTRTATWTWTQL